MDIVQLSQERVFAAVFIPFGIKIEFQEQSVTGTFHEIKQRVFQVVSLTPVGLVP